MFFVSILYKAIYWYISTIDRKKEVLFMNYGYHDSTEEIELHKMDEINRYSIQLYYRLAKMVDIHQKDIVEVGSGRGGGLAYITKRFTPSTALGIDLNKKAARFGNAHYNLKGLTFRQGNAQQLDVPNDSVDVVFNVESSHRYTKMNLFLDEVYRILKPGGHFMITDFRVKKEMDKLIGLLAQYRFVKFDEQEINKEVVEALKLDHLRRKDLINRYAPPFLRRAFRDFAGSQGSPTFNDIMSGEMVYFVFGFQKPF
jgi:ubiquinone/menaquinone biosynthesis C-methylase UbiE